MRIWSKDMKTKIGSIIVAAGLAVSIAAAQTAPQKATPRATAKSDPLVDDVIEKVKVGLTEQFIIKQLAIDNKPVKLSTADMVRLKQANVSEAVMSAMMDPSSAQTTAQAHTPAAAPAPTPVVRIAETVPPPTPAPGPSISPASPRTEKKRVIVDAFDYSAVMTEVTAVFGNQQNIGAGIRDLLVDRITQSGKMVVVERSKIKEVEGEQDYGKTSRTQPGTGAQVGKIRVADAIIAGSVTIFGRDDKSIGGSGGGSSGCRWCPTGPFARGGIGLKKDKAVVAITYKIIDAETSEVLDSGNAKGESHRKGVGFGGSGGNEWKGMGAGKLDMRSSNFGATIIGEATQDCVNKLAEILNAKAGNMTVRAREVEANVVDVDGSSLTIAAGANDGVSVGEVFEVHHKLKELIDPDTKEVLDRKMELMGQMTITSVRSKIAIGTYSGSALPTDNKLLAIKKMPAQ